LNSFLENVPQDKEKFLTLRMIDTPNNLKILKDPVKQNALISETIALARDNGFDGVVLDLELSAIPFDSLIKQISSFTKELHAGTKKKDLKLSVALYGDTFYRLRPFDVKAISQESDNIMLMAYDFSKSRGNPGPNFPLKGREVYGYDFEKMIEDFLKFVPAQKVTVIFGLFGYDWEVDGNGKAVSYGDPFTYQQIENKFLGTCAFEGCSIKRKNDSHESEIQYKDTEGKSHRVWFEDKESISAKQKYLKQKGISSYSFWANSYF
jgi:spore germination protein